MPQKNNQNRRRRRPKRQNNAQSGRNNPTRRTRTAVSDLRGSIPIFPAMKRVMMRYFENELSFSTTGGVPGGYVFSANGLFDPNITGTGHQPMGFDQMMTFYNQATVVHAKITVDFYNPNGAGLPFRCAVYLSPATTILTGVSQIIENGEIVTGYAQSTVVMDKVLQLSIDCDIPAYFGRSRAPKVVVNDPNLYSTAASNPVEQVYFILTAFDTFTSASATTISFNVIIEYEAIFWEPRKITIS